MRLIEPLHRSLFAAVLLMSGAPALAQTSNASPASAMHSSAMQASAPRAHTLIAVSDCNPKLNLQQTGGYVGYAPGPWRGGYWNDPYGANFYQPPVTTTMPQLAIHYKNISPKTMTTIDFGLLANGILRAEVRDQGTFSPHAEIKHTFAISANVFPIQTGLPECVPLHIVFADGTKWRNPALPPKNQHIYYRPG